MLCPAHPTYSDFEQANLAYTPRLEVFLASVCASRATHARFLNTLSMLEHMGARRIALTQGAPALGQDTLKHMAEEARHAFFFKRHADRLAGAALEFDDSDMIAPASARMYFRRLEQFIVADLEGAAAPRRLTYLYMSMIIEFRAVWAFSIYQSVLKTHGIQFSLKSLLAEERIHLADMGESVAALDSARPDRIARFLDKERDLFARLLELLESSASKNAVVA